jgi:hypothetical protein
MTQYLGIVKIAADGIELESFPGAKIDLGGYKNNPTSTSTSVGFIQEQVASSVECDIAITADTDLDAINYMRNVTLSIVSDVGKHYVIRNAFRTDTLTFTAGEGKGALKFSGPPAEKI